MNRKLTFENISFINLKCIVVCACMYVCEWLCTFQKNPLRYPRLNGKEGYLEERKKDTTGKW